MTQGKPFPRRTVQQRKDVGNAEATMYFCQSALPLVRNTRKERSPRGKKYLSSNGRQEDYRLIAITNPRQSHLLVPQGVSELV